MVNQNYKAKPVKNQLVTAAKFSVNAGCSWLFSLTTCRSMLPWEISAKSGSSASFRSCFTGLTIFFTGGNQSCIFQGNRHRKTEMLCLSLKAHRFGTGKLSNCQKGSLSKFSKLKSVIHVQNKNPEEWPISMLFLNFFSVVTV